MKMGVWNENAIKREGIGIGNGSFLPGLNIESISPFTEVQSKKCQQRSEGNAVVPSDDLERVNGSFTPVLRYRGSAAIADSEQSSPRDPGTHRHDGLQCCPDHRLRNVEETSVDKGIKEGQEIG